jgi:hypothetical protein
MKELVEQVKANNPCLGSIIAFKGVVYSYWDEGCTRYVFTNEDQTKVIKIPKDGFSQMYNDSEYETYSTATEEDRDKMALTELVDGVIVQEFVMPIKWAGKKLTIPQEIFARKCRNEVGWDSEGELVCFDLDEYLKY